MYIWFISKYLPWMWPRFKTSSPYFTVTPFYLSINKVNHEWWPKISWNRIDLGSPLPLASGGRWIWIFLTGSVCEVVKDITTRKNTLSLRIPKFSLLLLDVFVVPHNGNAQAETWSKGINTKQFGVYVFYFSFMITDFGKAILSLTGPCLSPFWKFGFKLSVTEWVNPTFSDFQ